MKLNGIHHVAIICSDYERSKNFYTQVLGFTVLAEHYRHERKSYKLDLALNNSYTIELFSFPDPPGRVTRPEATGLRHLAFEVDNIDDVIEYLTIHDIFCDPVRTDEYTLKRFTFISDPDGLPIEFYER